MPKKSNNQSIMPQHQSEQNQINEIVEDFNEERNINESEEDEDKIPDLTGKEQETIEDRYNNIYSPERFSKCFLPQNDLAKQLTNLTLRFILAKKNILIEIYHHAEHLIYI